MRGAWGRRLGVVEGRRRREGEEGEGEARGQWKGGEALRPGVPRCMIEVAMRVRVQAMYVRGALASRTFREGGHTGGQVVLVCIVRSVTA